MINKIQATTPNLISFKQAYRKDSDFNSYSRRYNASSYSHEYQDDYKYGQSCLDCYDSSRIGYIPRYPAKNRISVPETRGLIETIGDSIESGKANHYEKMRVRVAPVEATVSNYFRNNLKLADLREDSITNFEDSRSNHFKYLDFLTHVNPMYMRQHTPYTDCESFFGPNSRIFYSKERKTVPYCREIFSTNSPFALAIGQLLDPDGTFYGAKELYDFNKSIMYRDINFNRNNSFSASQINVFNPGKCDLPFSKVARAFRSPVTFNKPIVDASNNLRAASIVVYRYDKFGNITGTKVFVGPKVQYVDPASPVPAFSLQAKLLIETEFDGIHGKNIRFLEDPLLNYSNGNFSICAKQALEFQKNGLTSFYANYDDSQRKLHYQTKQIIDLNRK